MLDFWVAEDYRCSDALTSPCLPSGPRGANLFGFMFLQAAAVPGKG